jgi:hypothetical protein
MPTLESQNGEFSGSPSMLSRRDNLSLVVEFDMDKHGTSSHQVLSENQMQQAPAKLCAGEGRGNGKQCVRMPITPPTSRLVSHLLGYGIIESSDSSDHVNSEARVNTQKHMQQHDPAPKESTHDSLIHDETLVGSSSSMHPKQNKETATCKRLNGECFEFDQLRHHNTEMTVQGMCVEEDCVMYAADRADARLGGSTGRDAHVCVRESDVNNANRRRALWLGMDREDVREAVQSSCEYARVKYSYAWMCVVVWEGLRG